MFQNFTAQQLEEILEEIAKRLKKPLTVYAFGGAVMVFDGLKTATKDIDLLFASVKSHERFVEAARLAGFVARANVPRAYEKLGVSSMLENTAKKWRLDLFTKIVCGKLSLTKGMKARAEPFRKHGKLEVKRLSYEDIALLKAVADRSQDHEDLKAIWQAKGLKRKTLETEMLAQAKHLTYLLPTLEEVAAQYGIGFKFSKKIVDAFERQQKQELDALERQLKKRRKHRREV